MTLLPLEPHRITVVPEGALGVYPWRGPCRWPDCEEPATDPHHVVRRSAGGKTWIAVDGASVPNIAGLCRPHHDPVTDGRARIVWDDDARCWAAEEAIRIGGWDRIGPLRPLFPTATSSTSSPKASCPGCGRRWPKPKPDMDRTARQRRSLSIKVPDDGEDGAAIIATLADAVAEEVYGEATERLRYFAITAALAAVLQDPSIVAELVDA